MREVLAGGFKLKKAEHLCDRSAPTIFQGTQLKKNYDRRLLMQAVREHPRLNHVLSEKRCDRSAPRIVPHLHISRIDRRTFLDEVLQGAEKFYARLISALASSASQLKTSIRDHSLKFFTDDTREAFSSRNSLLKDIRENRAQLHHVQSSEKSDRSRPFVALASDQNQRQKLFNEVKVGVQLEHPDKARSAQASI